MKPPAPDRPVTELHLSPGGFCFDGGPKRIHTLLGSCVAVTLWHPKKQIGGMCHYLLPSRGTNQRLSKGHYAEEALELFLEAIEKAKTKPKEYEVKIFGGGHLLGGAWAGATVSQENIRAGERLLAQHGFEIKAADVGGCFHRKLYLELWNGLVWVQRGKTSEQGNEG